MSTSVPIWLASGSSRRRRLLEEAGVEVMVKPSDLDDADLTKGSVQPELWVMALAYFKARRVSDLLNSDPVAQSVRIRVILGADTLCVCEDEVFGQPQDMNEATHMIRRMCNRVHRTMTGVCLLAFPTGRRFLTVDQARITVGDVSERRIEEYINSGQWRGKAGGYNLSERIEAGWPISCEGDPATVMGLPMRKLPDWIKRFRISL